jgi:DNA-binding transcriptional ArsR family regulator
VSTRERIRPLLAAGLSISAIARKVGVTPPTVCYHARQLGYEAIGRRHYDWSEVQVYYDTGASFRECRLRFGFSAGAWHKAVQRGEIKSRRAGAPLEELLVAGRRIQGIHLKKRLIRAGLKEDRCEECGIDEWCGQPLPAALHHINGDVYDNRLENIQLLCPNCHSQTENFAGRNARRPRGGGGTTGGPVIA